MKSIKPIVRRWLKPAIGLVLVTGAIFGAVPFFKNNTTQAADWTDNAIIRGGVSNASDFVTKVRNGNNGTQNDLKTIMAEYAGLPEADYDRFASTAQTGVSKRDGTVWVGDRMVASNSQSLGRSYQNKSEAVNLSSGTYYQNFPRDNFLSDDIPVMVSYNAAGHTQSIIMNDCGNPFRFTPNNPAYSCNTLSANAESAYSLTYKFSASVAASNGASINKLVYNFGDGASHTTTNVNEVVTHKYAKTGVYQATLTVFVNVPGNQVYTIVAAANCIHTVTIKEEPKPSVKIDKVVNGKELVSVKINEQFTYTLKVTNDGKVDLTKVVVTDKAPAGIQFISTDKGSIANNSYSYTIPSLKIGESVTINIKAKATKYSATPVVNEACVNAPEVNPGNPSKSDDCDDAKTTTPEPKKVVVCDPSDRVIKQVNEEDASKYLPVDSDKCANIKVCIIDSGNTTLVPIYKDQFDATKHSTNPEDCKKPEITKIPSTGPEILGGLIGSSSIAYGAYAYAASRRAIRRIR